MIKWHHILNFNFLKRKINFWGPFSFIFLAQKQSRTALGSLAPLKEPLRMQNTHFWFNVQLLGDKMGSHFEFQLFKVKNKLFSSVFVFQRRLGWILGKFLQRSILPKKIFFLSFTIEFVFTRISYITYLPLQISCRVPLSVLLLYYNPMLDAGGHLPYSNIEIWKLNASPLFKIICVFILI